MEQKKSSKNEKVTFNVQYTVNLCSIHFLKKEEVPKYFPMDTQEEEVVEYEVREDKKEKVVKKVAKINKYWYKNKRFLFVPYLPSDNDLKSENGKETVEILNESLSELLKQEYHVFWSMVVNERSLWKSMETYLRFKSRAFEPAWEMKEKEPHSELFERVFKTYVRMATPREDKSHFLSDDFYNHFAQESRLFSLPSLLDFCVLFCAANTSLVRDVVSRHFQLAQTNWNLLSKLIPTSKKVLQALFEGKRDQKKKNESNMYLLDFLATLACFTEIFPKSYSHLQKNNNLSDLLCVCFSSYIPTCSNSQLMDRLLLKMFEGLLENCFFSVIYNVSHDFNAQAATLFLKLLEKMEQTHREKDEENLLVICQQKFDLKRRMDSLLSKGKQLSGKIDPFYNVVSSYPVEKASVVVMKSGKKKDKGVRKEEALIQEVRNVFPKLGEGFVEKCLEFYDFSVETVLDALLTENLDTSLENLNRNMPRKNIFTSGELSREDSEEENSMQESDERILFTSSGMNIYDQLEMNGIEAHRGKKKMENFLEMIGDTSQAKYVSALQNMYDDDVDEMGEGVGNFSMEASESEEEVMEEWTGNKRRDTEEEDDKGKEEKEEGKPANESQKVSDQPVKKSIYSRKKKTHNRREMSNKKRQNY